MLRSHHRNKDNKEEEQLYKYHHPNKMLVSVGYNSRILLLRPHPKRGSVA